MANDQLTQVAISRDDSIGIITIHYPPVNALSQNVRQGIVDGIEKFSADDSVKAIIIRCAERTFIAGADIKEFGLPPSEPFLPDVVNKIEASDKPVIAAMFGTSLGGGFEVALACHYRVALADAKVGLPEVNLGLIPGAGGTQRLPRIVGAKKALEMVTGGKHYAVSDFAEFKLFDAIFPKGSDLDSQTLSFAKQLVQTGELRLTRVGQLEVNDTGLDWDLAIQKINNKARGQNAPVVAAKVMLATKSVSIAEGMAIERKAFLELRESEQSAALRHAFAVEKQAAKTSLDATPIPIDKVGIIGAGNMGSGIATAFLVAGFEVCLVEQNQQGLDAGVAKVTGNLQSNVKRGRMSQAKFDDAMSRLNTTTNYQELASSQLIIEAIFEDIKVKKELFSKLDEVCNAETIFATNTSYLDINEIASVVDDPSRVVGMHFFSPAHIMKLLEVVKAEHSSDQAVVTAMTVAKKLKKVSVLVGVCFGFAGNRMYTRYGREIQQMLLEGASISQIDKAMTAWGMAMGPLAVQDLSGIDIGHNARSAQPFPEHDPGYFRAAATMVENNRLGRKTGSGFYQYDEQGKPVADPEASELILQKAQELGIEQKTFTDEAIVERALMALICEGVSLYQQGIVQRLSDVDVIWLHGYGFPRYKGGPVFQARQMGIEKIEQTLKRLTSEFGETIWSNIDLSCLS